MKQYSRAMLLSAFVLTVAVNIPAHATLITFDGLAGTAIPGNSIVGSTFTGFAANVPALVDGFEFRSSGPQYFLGDAYTDCCNDDLGYLAYNGTDYLIGLPDITVNKLGGGVFDLQGFDLAEWDNTFTTSIKLTTLGTSGTTTEVLPLSLFSNNFLNSGNDFKHFDLSGYDNVVSFTLTGNVNWAFIALDNLKVSESVPEPASLTLAGLGLALLGFSRRRQT